MFNKRLSRIVVSTELYHVEPLQKYIGYLARYCQVSESKLFHLEILVEEIITHIISGAFNNKSDGEIDIEIFITHANFMLRFHYLGLPFGYNMERVKDDQDAISLTLIRSLCASYRMIQQGKSGQTVEISIALPSQVNESLYIEPKLEQEVVLATDNVILREVQDHDLEMLVQCLYNVFGYTYSADSIYYPEVILERMRQGIYQGFVAINESNVVVAHVAMLKDSPDDEICESGQAFVSPEYGNRRLFYKLKKYIIDKAEVLGLRGVYSSSVAGHSFTQRVNVELGCVEVGVELAYVPAMQKSMIPRKGEDQRQSVISYFFCTSHQKEMDIYAPKQHREIMEKTYSHLGLKRFFKDIPKSYVFENDESVVEMKIKTEWNQLHLHITRPGKDLAIHIKSIIRQVIVKNLSVAYIRLSLCDPATPAVVDILEKLGFYYSGIMPYENKGNDSIRMQFLVDSNIDPGYIVTKTEWGALIKEYVFACKRKQDALFDTVI